MYERRGDQQRRTQAERRAETRRALLAAARQLFAERGYAAASSEEIVGLAGVTRGALYHHFKDKRDLFRAVVEEIEQEIDERVLGVMDAGGSADTSSSLPDQLLASSDAFLDACTRRDVTQILLLDGPSVLGWKEWREIDAGHALAQIEQGLVALMDAGLIESQPAAPLAHLIYGMLIEAALYIAAADDRETARLEMRRSLHRLLALPPRTGEDIDHS